MSEFDQYADSYGDDVERAIDFCGQEHEYFVRRKAEALLEVVSRRVADPSELTVLDVGCGVGTTGAFLAEHVGMLLGVDTSADAVARAAVRNPAGKYCSYDGESLPYEDASVDVAFAICVMHHIDAPDRPRFVRDLRRVVRPGGLVVVFEHNPYNPLTRRVVRNCPFDEGVVLLTRRTTERFLRDAGLAVEESKYMLFFPIDKPAVAVIERRMGWLPAGAQHYVAARRTA